MTLYIHDLNNEVEGMHGHRPKPCYFFFLFLSFNCCPAPENAVNLGSVSPCDGTREEI